MTVQELIDELIKVEDKSKPVKIASPYITDDINSTVLIYVLRNNLRNLLLKQ